MHKHKKNKNVCSAYACALGLCFCVVGVLTTVCFYSFDGEEDSLDVPTFFFKTSMHACMHASELIKAALTL